jgi:hypothetical protein
MNKKNNCTLFLVLTFFSLAFDSGGDFGLRALILPIGLMGLILNNGFRITNTLILIFTLLVVWPIISLGIGISNGADLEVALSQYKGLFFGFLMVAVLSSVESDKMLDIFTYSIVAIALFVDIISAGLLLGFSWAETILSLLAPLGGGYFGYMPIGGILIPNIYFKSTLFFVPAFWVLLRKDRLMMAALIFISTIFAISKTAIISCVLILVASVFFNNNSKKRLYVFIFLVLAALYVVNHPIYSKLEEISSGESVTVSIRQDHIGSLINYWSENPIDFIIGSGLGSTFFSVGAGEYVNAIELDHLNIIRKHGIIWFGLFMALTVYISTVLIRSGDRNSRTLGVALGIAFIVAGTNPVLLTPIFFVLLGISLGSINQKRFESKRLAPIHA